MFWPARIWNTYSLPIRRAGSPVHDSSWPRTANETPAASRQVATARATRRLRSSNAAAQPTQYRTSSASSSPGGLDVRDGADLERQALRPVEPRRRRLAPRVGDALHALERAGQLLREARVLEHEVAADADDLVDVLDRDRARLDAGAAGQAVPDGVVRDRGVDERPRDGRPR